MYDLLITNGTVITVDGAHHVYRPGYVAVKDGLITAVGPMDAFPENTAAKKLIDASGYAVMPGLIDGHGHAGHCLIKTLAEETDDWGSMAEDIYFHYADDFFWYAEGALAAAERLKFGITTGVSMLGSTPRPDSLNMLSAHFEGALKTGIRQISGIGFCDGPWPKRPWIWENGAYKEFELTPEQAIENVEKAVKTLNGRHKRQTCIPAPGSIGYQKHAGFELSVKANKAMARIAKTYGMPLHTHSITGGVKFAYESSPEVFTETSSFTHSTGLTAEEIKIFADTGAFVFHGPTTHANILQRCPVYELIRAGANVAIVTDGTAPDRSYDIWRDMKVFQVIHRLHENDAALAPPGFVLELCTVKPARALGISAVAGQLSAGKNADIILVDTDQPHLAPSGIMPVPRLVYNAQGQDVKTVIVGGEVMMEDRKLLNCDEKQILRDADKALAGLFLRMGPEKVKPLLTEDSIYEMRLEKR